MSKRPPGTLIKLRETVHERALCEPGDILQTSTGRRYEVVEVDGRKIVARVMLLRDKPAGDARFLSWTWDPRRKPKPKGLPFTEGSVER